MLYIKIRSFDAWEYFSDHLMPIQLRLESWERTALFDAWLDWLVGTDRVDVVHHHIIYKHSTLAGARLIQFNIPFDLWNEDEMREAKGE